MSRNANGALAVQAFGLPTPMRMLRVPLLLLALPVLLGAAHPPGSGPFAKRHFGFSLNTSPNGDLFTTYLYTVLDGRVVGSQPIRPETFILQACGLIESTANLESIDLFEQYGIVGCSPIEYGVINGLECRVLRDLWKLRFQGAALPGAGAGWAAEEFIPSARQQVLLQAYRTPDQPHWQGPYVGADAFRLLRDMQDPAWVQLYRDGG